jgi:hypothetical protein
MQRVMQILNFRAPLGIWSNSQVMLIAQIELVIHDRRRDIIRILGVIDKFRLSQTFALNFRGRLVDRLVGESFALLLRARGVLQRVPCWNVNQP